MKKAFILSLTLMLLLLLCACSGTYTVHFETSGGSEIADINVAKGETLIVTKPVRSGYHFTGWYSDSALTVPWDVKAPVNGDMTLYAAWEKNAGGVFKDGDDYYLYDLNGEKLRGEYSFYPAGDTASDTLYYFSMATGAGEKMTVTRLTDNLIAIMNAGNNTIYIAIGSDSALLCDTFEGFGDFKKLMELFVGDLPYACALTHSHGDHCPGVFSLDAETPVYVGSADMESLMEVSFEDSLEYYMTHSRSERITIADYPAEKSERNLVTAGDGVTVDLGDYPIEFFSIPGHTPGSIALLFVKDRMVLTGDGLNGDTLLRLPMEQILPGYEALWAASDRYDHVLVSHGGPTLYDKTMVENVTGFVREICENGYAEGEEPSKNASSPNAYYVGNIRTGGLTYYKESAN